MENIMKNWQFELDQLVRMSLSREQGRVIGRAEYADRPDLYLVRYVAGDGRQVENWQDVSALTAVPDLEED